MKQERGHGLIELLVVIMVIGVLGGIYFAGNSSGEMKSSREDGLGKSTVGASQLKAKDMVCKNQLSQVKSFIQMAHIDDEKVASLSNLNMSPSMLNCPIGKEPYELNVAEQKVTCPHPGHQSY